MKLGNDTIVLVTTAPTGETDDWGNDVLVDSYLEVRWCSVTPGSRSEAGDRSVPTISGLDLLAPPSTPLSSSSVVIWPATATGNPDTPWDGPRYQVVGDAGQWGAVAVQAHLERRR